MVGARRTCREPRRQTLGSGNGATRDRVIPRTSRSRKGEPASRRAFRVWQVSWLPDRPARNPFPGRTPRRTESTRWASCSGRPRSQWRGPRGTDTRFPSPYPDNEPPDGSGRVRRCQRAGCEGGQVRGSAMRASSSPNSGRSRIESRLLSCSNHGRCRNPAAIAWSRQSSATSGSPAMAWMHPRL